MLTILDGSTFCVSDDNGQITTGVHGLFADDTRFLSQLALLVDGRSPLLLGSGTVEYFNAAFYLRNAATDTLPRDTISIGRERFVEHTLTERITITNEGDCLADLPLTLALGSDFTDIITLKAHQFAVEAGEQGVELPPIVTPVRLGPRELVLVDPASELITWVVMSHDYTTVEEGESNTGFALSLEPGEAWELVLEVLPSRREQPRPARSRSTLRFGRARRQVQDAVAAYGFDVPRLVTSERVVYDAYYRSIADLASLRLRGFGSEGELPAAGMPWFMTVFGRDTLITSLQTLVFGPELAIGALRSLASLQASGDHPETDAEPGKIPHEVRRGKAAAAWFPIYYGSIDATPLFLILLSEVWRWTGDDAIVRELEDPARAALTWIDACGDRDGDGLVEYERRTPRGLENQSWKDSGDSQRFRDGTIAVGPIAPVEVQGYVVDAKRRCAELARAVWRDPEIAERLEDEADRLAGAIDRLFWMPGREAYALALDGSKRQVDTVCSNMGHLLWSGIVPSERRQAVVDHLLSPRLWSGWGIRTMAGDEIPYNPISYHNGTVWPHDTSLVAWGLRDSGFEHECNQVCHGLFEAAGSFATSLPEVFAGYARDATPFVVDYPTSSRPQAWAAGSPVLCLQLALGLRPDHDRHQLVTSALSAPFWLGELELQGIRAFGRRWTATVRDGAIRVREGR